MPTRVRVGDDVTVTVVCGVGLGTREGMGVLATGVPGPDVVVDGRFAVADDLGGDVSTPGVAGDCGESGAIIAAVPDTVGGGRGVVVDDTEAVAICGGLSGCASDTCEGVDAVPVPMRIVAVGESLAWVAVTGICVGVAVAGVGVAEPIGGINPVFAVGGTDGVIAAAVVITVPH